MQAGMFLDHYLDLKFSGGWLHVPLCCSFACALLTAGFAVPIPQLLLRSTLLNFSMRRANSCSDIPIIGAQTLSLIMLGAQCWYNTSTRPRLQLLVPINFQGDREGIEKG